MQLCAVAHNHYNVQISRESDANHIWKLSWKKARNPPLLASDIWKMSGKKLGIRHFWLLGLARSDLFFRSVLMAYLEFEKNRPFLANLFREFLKHIKQKNENTKCYFEPKYCKYKLKNRSK